MTSILHKRLFRNNKLKMEQLAQLHEELGKIICKKTTYMFLHYVLEVLNFLGPDENSDRDGSNGLGSVQQTLKLCDVMDRGMFPQTIVHFVS